jgi:hypothetical protein
VSVEETESLSRLVADFGEAMRRKLWKKLREGYRGWNGNGGHEVEVLADKLAEHVNRYRMESDPSQLVDIANLAALLWRIEVQIPHNRSVEIAERRL